MSTDQPDAQPTSLARTSKRIIKSIHSGERLQKRQIDIAEVEYALKHHTVELPGRSPGTTRIICDMAFGRKLSVVFKEKEKVIILISAWWVGETDESES